MPTSEQGRESILKGSREVGDKVFENECGAGCPAMISLTPLMSERGTGSIIECDVLNAMLTGDVEKTKERIRAVLEGFKGDKRLSCAPIRVFERLTGKPDAQVERTKMEGLDFVVFPPIDEQLPDYKALQSFLEGLGWRFKWRFKAGTTSYRNGEFYGNVPVGARDRVTKEFLAEVERVSPRAKVKVPTRDR